MMKMMTYSYGNTTTRYTLGNQFTSLSKKKNKAFDAYKLTRYSSLIRNHIGCECKLSKKQIIIFHNRICTFYISHTYASLHDNFTLLPVRHWWTHSQRRPPKSFTNTHTIGVSLWTFAWIVSHQYPHTFPERSPTQIWPTFDIHSHTPVLKFINSCPYLWKNTNVKISFSHTKTIPKKLDRKNWGATFGQICSLPWKKNQKCQVLALNTSTSTFF